MGVRKQVGIGLNASEAKQMSKINLLIFGDKDREREREREKAIEKRYSSRSFHESRTSISGRLLARTIMHIRNNTRNRRVYTETHRLARKHAYVERSESYLVK
ncbi:hypothetical protein P5V15_011086 [Pogonomyrmex californicus]